MVAASVRRRVTDFVINGESGRHLDPSRADLDRIDDAELAQVSDMVLRARTSSRRGLRARSEAEVGQQVSRRLVAELG